jgi:IS605 OrfB family transposase
MANQVTRTYVASIRNHQQVRDDLDSLGFAASKLWNIARWTCGRIWDETDTIPDHGVLKAYLKNHERYADLNAQSSQAILEELAEAFDSWYTLRGNGDENANPPGYRKHGDEHPRSTVTFKEDGFKHDPKHNQIRLSKGRNLKDGRQDFILCEYAADPDVTVQNVQQVRAVWTGTEWELHIVCNVEIDDPDPPGDRVAGIDLGICNFATVAYSTEEADLYPGNRLKQDGYYFPKEIAKCDDSGGEEATRLHEKWSERRAHFFHSLAKHIVQRCVENQVGRINVGDLEGIREGEDGGSKNWGRHGNLDLHGWAFDRFTDLVEYKAKVEGIEVVEVSERDTSKTCCMCGREDESQRVERGLYVCEECDAAFNADVNGAENIRLDMNESNSESSTSLDEDRSTGWLAQPGVYLYDLSCGFQPQREVVDSKP